MTRLKNFIIIFILIAIVRAGLYHYQKAEINQIEEAKPEIAQEEDYFQSEEFRLKQEKYNQMKRKAIDKLYKN